MHSLEPLLLCFSVQLKGWGLGAIIQIFTMHLNCITVKYSKRYFAMSASGMNCLRNRGLCAGSSAHRPLKLKVEQLAIRLRISGQTLRIDQTVIRC